MWPHYTANKNKNQCTAMKSFDIWLEAWTIYEDLLLDKDPVPYKEVSTYRDIIHKANRKYMWSSVYSYDVHFRSNAAIDPNTCFDVLDTALYKTLLGQYKTQTMQTADCRLQTVQTVQTVQTELFFNTFLKGKH